MSKAAQDQAGILLVETPAEGILLLTLNRPDKLNALSKRLLGELAAALGEAATNPAVGCVVLTGAGRAFSAGADASDMLERGVASYADPERLARWAAIQHFPKPMIAAVNGYALGGGLELALMCDIILASEAAKFAAPEIKLGSFPGDGGTQRLPRAVGKSFAMQMILTGDMIDSVLAERKGLVSEVLEPDALIPRASAIASRIAQMSTAITPYAKRAVQGAFELPLAEGLSFEHRLTVEAFETEDRMEGLRAFAEKRTPIFRGK
ncbi:enoyl-CoA hydratase-related protein [Martelella sp. AMO21009]